MKPRGALEKVLNGSDEGARVSLGRSWTALMKPRSALEEVLSGPDVGAQELLRRS